MITFLLAVINFVVTVALHVLEISIKVAIQALKISAKTAKVAVKQGKKVTKKAAKKGAETTKKTARNVKGKIKEDLTENTKPETPQTADVRDVITSEDDVKDKVQKDKGGLTALKNINIKGMKLLQKSVHNALVLSRVCMIAVTIFVFVLTSLLITSSFAIISSAGYVALAYNNGVLGTNEDSDSSFDITKDGKDEDKDSSNTTLTISDTATLEEKLETLAKWYIANVHTYQNRASGKGSGYRKMYSCNLFKPSKSVGDDCTGFASAFMSLVSGKSVAGGGSSAFTGGSYDGQGDWKYYEVSDLTSIDDLQLGDILCCNTGTKTKKGVRSTAGHHAEIYIAKGKSFGWGKKQTSYPSGNATLKLEKNADGDPIISDGGSHTYTCFYRYTGK